jgi:phosphopantothenoylcysteine decarboxylase/phosphopantothenate--cysteine ligase
MKVCLGITGGIAAYKSAELVRQLQQHGLEVQVVMTRHACEFITPLTMASLSGRKVITEMFEGPAGAANIESAIEHISVAQAIDLLIVAPATANIIGKMANGIADDFLTTLYLATKAPVLVAPAMNVNMWEHPTQQENLARLVSHGVRVVDPEEGYLACGMTGAGRLASLEKVLAAALELLGLTHDLERETVLVTAGPTQEPIDPVRFIGNRSSGKMGYALAEAAVRRGARTILVSGPTALRPPDGVEFVAVRTAEEMRDAVLARLPAATIVIKAAAVADYRPAASSAQKIKKHQARLALQLEPTPDILAEVARQKGTRIVVGFAAETEALIEHARAKLQRKNLDLVVANDVSQDVFDSDFNTAVLVGPETETELPRLTKTELAHRILDQVVKMREQRQSSARISS